MVSVTFTMMPRVMAQDCTANFSACQAKSLASPLRKVDKESRVQWPARSGHTFGVRQPCWRFRCLRSCRPDCMASPSHSGRMTPALQGDAPSPPLPAARAVEIMPLSATAFGFFSRYVADKCLRAAFQKTCAVRLWPRPNKTCYKWPDKSFFTSPAPYGAVAGQLACHARWQNIYPGT
jgi:hypothetical protein